MGKSVDDGKARRRDYTWLPVHKLQLCHWSSPLLDLRASLTTHVPVPAANSYSKEQGRGSGFFSFRKMAGNETNSLLDFHNFIFRICYELCIL